MPGARLHPWAVHNMCRQVKNYRAGYESRFFWRLLRHSPDKVQRGLLATAARTAIEWEVVMEEGDPAVEEFLLASDSGRTPESTPALTRAKKSFYARGKAPQTSTTPHPESVS